MHEQIRHRATAEIQYHRQLPNWSDRTDGRAPFPRIASLQLRRVEARTSIRRNVILEPVRADRKSPAQLAGRDLVPRLREVLQLRCCAGLRSVSSRTAAKAAPSSPPAYGLPASRSTHPCPPAHSRSSPGRASGPASPPPRVDILTIKISRKSTEHSHRPCRISPSPPAGAARRRRSTPQSHFPRPLQLAQQVLAPPARTDSADPYAIVRPQYPPVRRRRRQRRLHKPPPMRCVIVHFSLGISSLHSACIGALMSNHARRPRPPQLSRRSPRRHSNSAQTARPNILHLMTDQQQWATIAGRSGCRAEHPTASPARACSSNAAIRPPRLLSRPRHAAQRRVSPGTTASTTRSTRRPPSTATSTRRRPLLATASRRRLSPRLYRQVARHLPTHAARLRLPRNRRRRRLRSASSRLDKQSRPRPRAPSPCARPSSA